MCGSMADIQSAAAEIRRGKKRKKNKPQHENIYGLPIPQGDHKKPEDENKLIMSASATQGSHNYVTVAPCVALFAANILGMMLLRNDRDTVLNVFTTAQLLLLVCQIDLVSL